LPTIAKLPGVADGGDQRAGGERANARDFEQPAYMDSSLLPSALLIQGEIASVYPAC
jgi:hypothetical protein